MYIAVTADGSGLDSIVSGEFENCAYLLIVNAGDMTVKGIKNGTGLNLAEEIIKHDCEAVITGRIDAASFNKLADTCITRYSGTGNTVAAAMELMDKNKLDVIRNAEGAEGCGGHHHAS